MSILAIARRMRPEFQRIAELDEVGAPVSKQTVTAIVDTLFHSDVASRLPERAVSRPHDVPKRPEGSRESLGRGQG